LTAIGEESKPISKDAESLNSDLRKSLIEMVLQSNAQFFLPTMGNVKDLPNGKLETARLLLGNITTADGVRNMTSFLIQFYMKVNPAELRPLWTESVQTTWLGKLMALQHKADELKIGEYIVKLGSLLKEFVQKGTSNAFFASSFDVDGFIQYSEDMADCANKLSKWNSRVADATKKMGPQVIEYLAAAGLSGGAQITSGLAAAGANSGLSAVLGMSNMAAGPVALALAPALGAASGVLIILPDDRAGRVGKRASIVAVPLTLLGVSSAVAANGAGAAAMSQTLAAWGGGSIATGGGGMSAGVAALGATAAAGVVVTGLGFYASYKVYETLSRKHLSKSEIQVLAMTSIQIRDAQMKTYRAMEAEARMRTMLLANQKKAKKTIKSLRAQLGMAGLAYLCSCLVLCCWCCLAKQSSTDKCMDLPLFHKENPHRAGVELRQVAPESMKSEAGGAPVDKLGYGGLDPMPLA
jgi:hypothetical protein